MFQGCGLCISSLAESCVVGPGKDVLRDLLAPCQMALVKYTLTSRGVRTSVAHIFHYFADFTRIRVTSPCLSVVSTRTFYSKNTAEFADGWNILEPSSPWPFAANFQARGWWTHESCQCPGPVDFGFRLRRLHFTAALRRCPIQKSRLRRCRWCWAWWGGNWTW